MGRIREPLERPMDRGSRQAASDDVEGLRGRATKTRPGSWREWAEAQALIEPRASVRRLQRTRGVVGDEPARGEPSRPVDPGPRSQTFAGRLRAESSRLA